MFRAAIAFLMAAAVLLILFEVRGLWEGFQSFAAESLSWLVSITTIVGAVPVLIAPFAWWWRRNRVPSR